MARAWQILDSLREKDGGKRERNRRVEERDRERAMNRERVAERLRDEGRGEMKRDRNRECVEGKKEGRS